MEIFSIHVFDIAGTKHVRFYLSSFKVKFMTNIFMTSIFITNNQFVELSRLYTEPGLELY